MLILNPNSWKFYNKLEYDFDLIINTLYSFKDCPEGKYIKSTFNKTGLIRKTVLLFISDYRKFYN